MLPPALSLLPAHPLAFLDSFQLRRDAAPRRPLEPPQPDAVRAAYLRDLLPLVRRAQELALEELSPLLEAAGGVRLDSAEGWREDRPAAKGKGKGKGRQAASEPAPRGRTLARPLPEGRVREAMARAAARFLKEHPAPVVKAKATRAGKATRKHTDNAVAAQFAAAARRKRQPLPMTPAIRKAVAAFTRENVALIKTIPRKHFAAIRRIVLQHGMAGARQTTIARELREQFGVTKRRAAIIARDQVGKLFGVLQQVRQQEAGVRSYVWRTVRDNRVRAKHEAREGKRYPWSKPPGGGHPGHEINCRCYPEPVLPRGSLPAPGPAPKPAAARTVAAPVVTPAAPKPAPPKPTKAPRTKHAPRQPPRDLTAPDPSPKAARVPTPAPVARRAPPLSSLSPQDFSGRVVEAALSFAREALEHTGPGDAPGMFGSDRVFIRHLWERMGDGISLEDFKARLLEANRSRLLSLARADLVEAMRQEDVRPSEIANGPARFHFVAIPFKQVPRR